MAIAIQSIDSHIPNIHLADSQPYLGAVHHCPNKRQTLCDLRPFSSIITPLSPSLAINLSHVEKHNLRRNNDGREENEIGESLANQEYKNYTLTCCNVCTYAQKIACIRSQVFCKAALLICLRNFAIPSYFKSENCAE